METIKAYVENIFRALPVTDEIIRAKEEILSNMLDKYNELKANGKSEHEAIGIVISEFGNIDELLEEMNLTSNKTAFEKTSQEAENSDNHTFRMSLIEVQEYLAAYQKAAKVIALGVLLCIIGVSMLILFSQLAEDNIFTSAIQVGGDDIFGLILLFVFIAIAVPLFISSGMSLSKYEPITKGVKLDKETISFLESEKARIQPSFTRNLIIGVLMCVISPIILIGGYGFASNESSYPVVVFLLVISLAVYLLVRSGVRFGSFTMLLTEAQRTPSERKSNTVTGTFCGAIMLIATAIYLYLGFMENKWHYAPGIYAIGGVLCGVVAVIVNGIETAKKK